MNVDLFICNFNLTIYDQKTIKNNVKILFKNFTFQASWMSFFIFFLYITWIISITEQQIQFYCERYWWTDYKIYGNFEKCTNDSEMTFDFEKYSEKSNYDQVFDLILFFIKI